MASIFILLGTLEKRSKSRNKRQLLSEIVIPPSIESKMEMRLGGGEEF